MFTGVLLTPPPLPPPHFPGVQFYSIPSDCHAILFKHLEQATPGPLVRRHLLIQWENPSVFFNLLVNSQWIRTRSRRKGGKRWEDANLLSKHNQWQLWLSREEVSGGILPQKMFKFGGYELLFSALFVSNVSKKSIPNNWERQAFSVLISQVLLIWNTPYI